MRSGRASAHVLHKEEKRLKRRLLFIDREALVWQVCAGINNRRKDRVRMNGRDRRESPSTKIRK